MIISSNISLTKNKLIKTTVSALTLRIEKQSIVLSTAIQRLDAQNKENRGALTNGSSTQKDARSSAALYEYRKYN